MQLAHDIVSEFMSDKRLVWDMDEEQNDVEELITAVAEVVAEPPITRETLERDIALIASIFIYFVMANNSLT